jgi:hypothetical protein
MKKGRVITLILLLSLGLWTMILGLFVALQNALRLIF